jgi:hypothetical protein
MTGPFVPVGILNLIRAVLGIPHHRFNLFVKCSRNAINSVDDHPGNAAADLTDQFRRNNAVPSFGGSMAVQFFNARLRVLGKSEPSSIGLKMTHPVTILGRSIEVLNAHNLGILFVAKPIENIMVTSNITYTHNEGGNCP